MIVLQIYLWLMAIYVVITLAATPFSARRFSEAGYTPSMWLEQAISYVLLIAGLVGVYGFVYSVPLLTPVFWQAFIVVLAAFSGLQHLMPKTRWLHAKHGKKAVILATVVGIALLIPMFVAIGLYAFDRQALWG